MNRFCRNCGSLLTDKAQFCTHCGAMVDAMRAPDPNEPGLHAGAPAPTSMTGLIRNSFRQAKEALTACFKNPKQLIPIVVLAAFWLALGILQAFGISPWPLKVLSFLTFAQGGLFGGFWGAVGGIIGKAIFAYFVSALLLPLLTGKASKKLVKEGFQRFISGFSLYGLGLVAALLMGIGASLIVFNFLSGNASLINSMPGLVGFVLAVRALIRRSGFFWNTLLMIANKLSKGRTPGGDTVHRFVSGFAVGGLAGVGLAGVGLSSLPWPYLPYLLGLALVIVGIALGIAARSRKEAVRT